MFILSDRSQKQVSTGALKWHDEFNQEHESDITISSRKIVRSCNIKIAALLRSRFPEMFCKKSVLKNLTNFTGKKPVSRLNLLNFIKKESPPQLFSREFLGSF